MKRTLKSIGFVLVACALMGCEKIEEKVGLQPDNALEEAAEAVLKAETGIVLDFTPDSPEK